MLKNSWARMHCAPIWAPKVSFLVVLSVVWDHPWIRRRLFQRPVPSRIPVSAHLHKIVVDRSLGRFPSPLEQGRPQYIVVMIKHAQRCIALGRIRSTVQRRHAQKRVGASRQFLGKTQAKTEALSSQGGFLAPYLKRRSHTHSVRSSAASPPVYPQYCQPRLLWLVQHGLRPPLYAPSLPAQPAFRRMHRSTAAGASAP